MNDSLLTQENESESAYPGPEDTLSQSQAKKDELDFMKSLGLVSVSQPSFDPPSLPVPIIAKSKELLKKFDDSVEHKYPPKYEEYCEQMSGSTKVPKQSSSRRTRRQLFKKPKGGYKVVTKWKIKKDGKHPHIYSFGRRQREKRYQELIIGFSKRCWKALNRVKPSKIVIKKMKLTKKTVKIPINNYKLSFLESKWRAAIEFPRIRLANYKEHATDDIRRYLPGQGTGSAKKSRSKLHDATYLPRNVSTNKHTNNSRGAMMTRRVLLTDLEGHITNQMRQYLPKEFVSLKPKLWMFDAKLHSPNKLPRVRLEDYRKKYNK